MAVPAVARYGGGPLDCGVCVILVGLLGALLCFCWETSLIRRGKRAFLWKKGLGVSCCQGWGVHFSKYGCSVREDVALLMSSIII